MARPTVAVIIPARYGSTRLPAKPLLADTGKPLIQHVYEQAMRVGCASIVLVATDDERIFHAVEASGGRAVMTRADHASGTDRSAEVAATLDADLFVNLQGDEPEFDPAAIDALVNSLAADPAAQVATLVTPIRTDAVYRNPNNVKVVVDDLGRALYFSRSPIPYVRDGAPDFAADPPRFLWHLGVYAYRREALLRLARTPPHPLELLEKLEQLRLLALGGVLRVVLTEHAASGVDTPEDYAAFVARHRARRGEAR